VVPPAPAIGARLQRCAAAAFYKGMPAARVGHPVRLIGAGVERKVRDCGFHVLRELSGHGVGRTIHESPTIPNYDAPHVREQLRDGAVITIEPLISAAPTRAFTDADGWTMRTRDGSLAAHFEHTVIVWKAGPEIVTRVST
jgi:methionyl aminopeptidase